MDQTSPSEAATGAEINALRHEVERLNQHRFVRIHNSIWQLISFQFLRGIAFGLGTAVGATIVVSWLAYSLAQIDFIPVVGGWAAEIADTIQGTD